MSGQRVVVVTGGGGGIGAAVAEALARDDWFVVTMDPLVTLDGAERLPAPEESTAGRIVAAGGAAGASTASVTDAGAVRALFEQLMIEHGRLDALVNVAGISRPTSFAGGTEEDWHSVLAVHLDGYRTVLEAALPIMAAAGHGRILGVTSGSGWRAADAGAYACAKRAVASLTWQLGRRPPPGVTINAMSPIAVTRMVTAALDRARAAGGMAGSATGGLSLGSMPQPEALGPLASHLLSDGFSWCSGEVIFAGGSETAVVEPPRLLEAVRTDGAAPLAHVLDAVVPGAFVPAEAAQASGGGGNPRFGDASVDAPNGKPPEPPVRSCALVTDRPELAVALTSILEARRIACHRLRATDLGGGVGGAGALAAVADRAGPLDAVVVALAGDAPAPGAADGWERILAEHEGIVDGIHADAGWARAAADHAAATGRPLRLVTLTDARTAGGRSRAQASAQLARAARRATEDRVAAFAVALEADAPDTTGEVVAHLLCRPEAAALSGAELVVGAGWFGLRSHPRPTASITFGGPEVPAWLDDALREGRR